MTITEHTRIMQDAPPELQKQSHFQFRDTPADPWRLFCTTLWNLKNDPWLDSHYKYRCVDADGSAFYYTVKPIVRNNSWDNPRALYKKCAEHNQDGYDSTDWQNSLERRPE